MTRTLMALSSACLCHLAAHGTRSHLFLLYPDGAATWSGAVIRFIILKPILGAGLYLIGPFLLFISALRWHNKTRMSSVG